MCSQLLKNRLVGSLRQTVASKAISHYLVHFESEAKRQFHPCLGFELFVIIRDNLLKTFFWLNHFAEEYVDEVVGRHDVAAWYENATLQKPVHHSQDNIVT